MEIQLKLVSKPLVLLAARLDQRWAVQSDDLYRGPRTIDGSVAAAVATFDRVRIQTEAHDLA